jgi:hypothetical protein
MGNRIGQHRHAALRRLRARDAAASEGQAPLLQGVVPVGGIVHAATDAEGSQDDEGSVMPRPVNWRYEKKPSRAANADHAVEL